MAARGGRQGGRRPIAVRIALTALVVGVLGPVALASGAAALNRHGASIDTGPAPLVSRQLGSPLALHGARPGDAATSFVEVTYRGEERRPVVLFGRSEHAELAPYLQVEITRGRGAHDAFVPDARDYLGEGRGVVFRGALADLPDDPSSGLVDPVGPWELGETVTYRFVVRMTGSDAAQGLAADQTFSWAVGPAA